MKKILNIFLIVVIIFNFIFCNNAYASGTGSEITSGLEQKANVTAIETILEEGEAPTTNNSSSTASLNSQSAGVSGVATVTAVLARLLNVAFALQIDLAMSLLTTSIENDGSQDISQFWFTIDRCVYNRIPLFNINYFDVTIANGGTSDTYTVGPLTITKDNNNDAIKVGIAKIYYPLRMLSLAISLLVLIYIGIRMALSTVASDQAKYKKMITSWVESIAILFVLVYIISFTITISETLTGLFFNLKNQIINNSTVKTTFEETARSMALTAVCSKSGFDVVSWSVIYWALLFMEAKFFWMYIKRFFMVGLLIIVSPLITITYSIDKAGDNKAQVFSNWIQEFLLNVLIQPLHALIYMIFVPYKE